VLPEQNKTDAGSEGLPFTERDIRDAARLLALIASREGNEAQEPAGEPGFQRHSSPLHREVLLSRAKKHFRDRQLRRQYFSRGIFGEPAWDTLLVLYLSEFSGRRLTIGRLVDWIEAPLSTTQRWIAYLEKERLVAKEGHPDDRRMSYVRLLDKGRIVLDDYFAAASE
jgi:DNA-binding MarR family transcriptional regulator